MRKPTLMPQVDVGKALVDHVKLCVEQKATIASQAAQIERLDEALQCLTDDVEQYIMEVRHAQ